MSLARFTTKHRQQLGALLTEPLRWNKTELGLGLSYSTHTLDESCEMPFDAPNLGYGLSDGDDPAYCISVVMIQSTVMPTAYLQCRLPFGSARASPPAYSSAILLFFSLVHSPSIELFASSLCSARSRCGTRILFSNLLFLELLAYDWGLSKEA